MEISNANVYSAPVNATANRRRFQISAAIFLFPTLIYPAIGGLVEGRQTTEKILTAWCMPLGLVWLLLLALTLVLWNQRRSWTMGISMAALVVLTLGSNPLITGWLLASLEQRYETWRLDRDEPLDAVIVLGGGTKSDPAFGRVEGGDRVLYAAEIYHQQKTKRLITTGGSPIPTENSASEDTKALWMRLGIPSSAIETVGGINTHEEMIELKRLLSEKPLERVGLLTSAFHLPRAMRLAESHGLKFIPIGADHYFEPGMPIRFQSFIPSESAAREMTRALREYLAVFFSR